MSKEEIKKIYENQILYKEYIEDLLERNKWVNFKFKERDDGKYDKIPIDPKTYGNAKTNDEGTWSDFNTAVEAYLGDNVAGVGFVVSEEDDIVFIDLDDCIDEHRNLSDTANDIENKINSYNELSPSHKGMHILCRGKLPGNCLNRNTAMDIEIYEKGRFFTFTGESDFQVGIESRQQEIDDVCDEYFSKQNKTKKESYNKDSQYNVLQPESLSEQDIEIRLEKALEDEKFKALWEGNSQFFHSSSEADQAFFNKLAFYFCCDPEAMKQVAFRSDLVREKWDRSDVTIHGA